MKVVKAAAQVLNTLWQYRDLRVIYKKVMIHKVQSRIWIYVALFRYCRCNTNMLGFSSLFG